MAFFLRVLKSRKWLLLPPIVLGVVGVVVFAQFRKELPRSEPAEQSKSLPVIRVRRQAVVPVVSGYGTATAARRWNAVSEVQGRIVEIHPQLESGNTVAANELLIRIDDTDTQLLLVQRQADLASARAQLQELQAEYESDLRLLPFARKQLELASREEQRALELQRRNATSLSEVDQLTSGRLVQEQTLHNLQTAISLYPSQMGAAQAAIALAQAQVREAERDIERTRIVAPFDGMLSGVDLEVGQFIGVNQSLFELFDDQRIEVTAQYSLEQLGKLLPSLSRGGVDDSVQASETDTLPFTARVVVRSGDYKREWIGRPVRISESVDQQSRTLGVVVQVLNRSNQSSTHELPAKWCENGESSMPAATRSPFGWATALRPGAFCEVTLQAQPRQGLITVPRSAMDGQTVYVVDSDNRLRARDVVAGFKYGNEATIVDGLNEGELVAVIAPAPAIEGLLVQPVEEAAPADHESVSATAVGEDSEGMMEGRRS